MLNLLPLHSREATSQAHRLCCCQWTFKQRSKFHWMSKLQIHSAFNKEISVQRVSRVGKALTIVDFDERECSITVQFPEDDNNPFGSWAAVQDAPIYSKCAAFFQTEGKTNLWRK